VLLIDKARFPREKVCGDAFSGKSIGIARELGLIGEFGQHPHAIVRGLTMVAPNGKAVTVPFPNATGMDFAGYTIQRVRTDNIFLSAALLDANIFVRQNFNVTALIRDETGAVCGVSGTDTLNGNIYSYKGAWLSVLTGLHPQSQGSSACRTSPCRTFTPPYAATGTTSRALPTT